MTTIKTANPKVTTVNISELKPGDKFSEVSHYTYIGKTGNNHQVKHLESGETINLTKEYIEQLLVTADQYHSEVDVTKEDKKDGTLGIRSIWENIHSSHVFTVFFNKQDEKVSATRLKELRQEQINKALTAIEKAKTAKKGVADAAEKAIKEIQENPILETTPGELRKLRGYKVQFTSRDGRYDCIDMDITSGTNVRPVNILTIQCLVYNGVKYNVKQ